MRSRTRSREQRPLLWLFLRCESDDDVLFGFFAKRLHRVFLLNGGAGRFEGDLLGSLFFAGFNGDGLCVNPFKLCERRTDAPFATSSGYACHAHQILGGRLFLGNSDADEQHGKYCRDNIYEFHF